MAGHSKWSNIKRKKGAQDAKRGEIFMHHSKDIYTAAKEGGGDVEMNPALRLAVEKARDANMPNENIERAIAKATGTLEGVRYEEVTYEGYGPGGIAVIINTLTDNRNRTAAEFRHAFRKNNGNLGESGSVSFLFDRQGYIVILNKNNKIDEDEITFAAIEAGADDIEYEADVFEIYTAPENFKSVSDKLSKSGYTFEEAEITLIPQSFNKVSIEEEQQTLDLIELLEDNEAAQDVHHNLEISE